LRVGWVKRRLEAVSAPCDPTLTDDEAVGKDGAPGDAMSRDGVETADPPALRKDDNKKDASD